MESQAELPALRRLAEGPPRGFGAETRIETEDGPRAATDLLPGMRLRAADGGLVALAGLLGFETGDWIALPGPEGGLAVAADQLMSCRHFLCAALFGQGEVMFRAGDLRGPGIRHSEGARRRFFLPVPERAAGLALGGYTFPDPSLGPEQSSAGEGGRVSGSAPSDGGSPHSLRPRGEAGPLARAILHADQVAQLCGAGILFRHVRD